MSLSSLHRAHSTRHSAVSRSDSPSLPADEDEPEGESLDRELLEMHDGEALLPQYQLFDVGYLVPTGRARESVIVTPTNFRLFIKSLQDAHTIWVPHGVIESLTRDGDILSISCKDARRIRLLISPNSAGDHSDSCGWFMNALREFWEISNPDTLFATKYAEASEAVEVDGWAVFRPRAYFENLIAGDAEHWSISTINENYKTCPTYPEVLVLPRSFQSFEMLTEVAKFRSRGRIPVLCWKHSNPTVNRYSTISRCSQPSVGLSFAECREDKMLLESIRLTNPACQTLHIIDARPRLNAIGNVVGPAQGGFEVGYANCELHFFNIENIHVMRSSQRELCNLIIKSFEADFDDSDWLLKLDATGWLKHLRSLLAGAMKIANLIDKDLASVVVHCSDGWDRASQLSALCQLILDPFYRTIEGFELLIEKEFCSFGHRFLDRCGSKVSKKNEDEQAPIFVQFLDCVFQIFRQHPNSFEFNEQFLLRIADEVYENIYGTFLMNSERERKAIQKNTISFWSWTNDPAHLARFRNRSYRQNSKALSVNASMKAHLGLLAAVGYFREQLKIGRYSFSCTL